MKLALNGQKEDISGIIYTFPDKLSEGLPEFAESIFDPRNVRGIFKGDYFYALWNNNLGYYYSCIKTNTDSRNGYVMLTVYAGRMVPDKGKQFSEKMRLLLDYFLSRSYKEFEFSEVTIKAREIEGLLTQSRYLQDVESSISDKEMAFRLYGNEDNLGLMLENPYQPSYADFKCILFVEESTFGGEAALSQSITRLTDQIKITYGVKSEYKDVLSSRASVMEGKVFHITYKKAGFADECIEVIAGKPCDYYTIDNNIINLKSSSAAGINFKREIKIQVVDEENGAVVKQWSSKIDDDKWADMQDSFKVDPNISHKITIKADGYEEQVLQLRIGDYGQKTIRLLSNAEIVSVTLQMGKEQYTDIVKMKSNNRLYHPLKEVENKKILQVKPLFFSPRNIVLVLLLFLVYFLLVWFAGKGEKAEKSTAIAEVTRERDSLNKELKKLNAEYVKIEQENEEKLQSYVNTINMIKQKISINSNEVANIIGSYNIQELDKLNEKLNNINQQHNQGREVVSSLSAEQAIINYFQINNKWILPEIRNYNDEKNKINANTFAEKIVDTEKCDFNTLTGDNGVFGYAKKNILWNDIVQIATNKCNEGANNYQRTQAKMRFMQWLNSSPQREGDTIKLDVIRKNIESYFD